MIINKRRRKAYYSKKEVNSVYVFPSFFKRIILKPILSITEIYGIHVN